MRYNACFTVTYLSENKAPTHDLTGVPRLRKLTQNVIIPDIEPLLTGGEVRQSTALVPQHAQDGEVDLVEAFHQVVDLPWHGHVDAMNPVRRGKSQRQVSGSGGGWSGCGTVSGGRAQGWRQRRGVTA